MNAAHWHLVLNHLPVIGTGFVIFLLIAGFVQDSRHVQKLALLTAFLIAMTAVAAYLTGEPAEKVVEHVSGVSESAIHAHEDFAEIAFAITGCLGGLGLLGLVVFRRLEKLPLAFMLIMLALAMASAGTMAYTASLGGDIRHSEIQPPLTPANTPVSSLGR